MDALKDLEGYVDDAIRLFVDKMKAREGQDIDMGLFVQLFAFDTIGEITFSKRFGFMDAATDDGLFASIERILRSASWLGQVPRLYWLREFLSPIMGGWFNFAVNGRHAGLRNFAAQEIESRKGRGSDHQDMLEKFLKVQKKHPREMNDDSVLSMATSNISAGSDTTAISIRSIIYYLLKNPEYKRKLVDEIDTRKKEGKITEPISLEQTKGMPYLQACMHEGLRCHPAVGMTLPRVTPAGGIVIDGRYIPEGTVVGVNPWVVHRDKKVFGEDAESFRPDRWLNPDTSEMERFFFAFGYGARGCLGKNVSWMEMAKLIPTLFLNFDIELTDPTTEWREICWWFVKQEGVHVTLRPRSSLIEKVKKKWN